MAESFMRFCQRTGRAPASGVADLSPSETYVYQTMRRMHCARDKGHPECKGAVTIDAKGILLQCVLCGEARGRNAGHEEPLPERERNDP